MKQIVLKFGLIAGGILAALVVVTVALFKGSDAGFEYGELIGYSSMVLAFLLVFFGIRSYRERVQGGSITFGRAFKVGILITIVACSMYVATWEVIYYGFARDFMEEYTAHMIEKMVEEGESAEAITAKETEMAKFAELYDNPLVNVGMTFLEVFPVGLIMTLVSAGILRKRSDSAVETGVVA